MNDWQKKFYAKFAELRNKIFDPITKVLMFLRITPNMVSIFGVFLMVLFVVFAKTNSPWLLLILYGSWLIDLIDGPLARNSKTANDKGKFVDMFCDNLNFTLFVLGVIQLDLVSGFVGALLIYFMAISKLFRSIYNAKDYVSDWRFKAVAGLLPNFIVALAYIHLGVYFIFNLYYFDYIYLVFASILIIDSLSHFKKIAL